MFFKNGVLTETPFRSVNHYASLPQYTEDDKKQIADLCAVCARSYSKCLGKTHKEDTWFGALDVFSYVSEAHRFSSEFPLIRKWSEDWKAARLTTRSLSLKDGTLEEIRKMKITKHQHLPYLKDFFHVI